MQVGTGETRYVVFFALRKGTEVEMSPAVDAERSPIEVRADNFAGAVAQVHLLFQSNRIFAFDGEILNLVLAKVEEPKDENPVDGNDAGGVRVGS